MIEYISPTIAKEKLFENIHLKLKSPEVLSPTSKYISELGEIYQKYQNNVSRDSELIRLAVNEVIELSEIWEVLPSYIKPKNIDKISSLDDTLKDTCIDNLLLAIYDTRNEIAHAKANYEKKGTECPTKHRQNFSQVLDKIAVRCIRWFAMQPEDKRVLLP